MRMTSKHVVIGYPMCFRFLGNFFVAFVVLASHYLDRYLPLLQHGSLVSHGKPSAFLLPIMPAVRVQPNLILYPQHPDPPGGSRSLILNEIDQRSIPSDGPPLCDWSFTMAHNYGYLPLSFASLSSCSIIPDCYGPYMGAIW